MLPTIPKDFENVESVGIDLVKISRFETKLDNDRFIHKIFLDEELQFVQSSVNRAARLAARWAAKEAVAKALGCGFGESLSWRDIVVKREENGKPYIWLSDKAKKFHNNPDILISMSHDGDYAIAIALKR